ncbi:protein kinase [Micromonospora andamanensis]|uniref:non-specific serine/threonine protein kinase n=1 Tax=Micromonospora andamanensis TaxID=1287068 RepID=A0ABQ4HX96_9ACTN|nr:serine/threonine-protein kinase [Micromonospora andamanensis]GIJ10267.1 hypothetical protein Van01_34810 [Micromonospora andamanensis]
MERIGAYRVERLLGVGSFATVWLAYDPMLDIRVAIKVLAENWHHDVRVRERFLDEARLLRQLEDDRLVRVRLVGELPDGRPYTVLDWADGGSLRERLASGPLPVTTALDLLAEIAAGVAVLHRHRVVHRDLSPGNILFRSTADGERVLIADLGLAKALAAASGLTMRAGTPGFMAPEQDDALAIVDERADVYALGQLGRRLLAPSAPDAEPTAAAAVDAGPSASGADVGPPASGAGVGPPDAAVITVGLPAAGPARRADGVAGAATGSVLPVRVPPAVAVVLRRATASRPSDRYPDAEAFRTALLEAVRRSSGPINPGTGPEPTPAHGPHRADDPAPAPADPVPSVPARAAPASAVPASAVPARAASASAVPTREVPAREVPARAGSVYAGSVAAVPVGAGRSPWVRAVALTVVLVAAAGAVAADSATPSGTATSGPLTVVLPDGWRATGTGWAGRYDASGRLEPALVISPEPRRWATDPRVPGAFLGLSVTARHTDPATFVAAQPHANCAPSPPRRVRRGGLDWVVARFDCPYGRPVLVEAAARGTAGLLYAQVVPPPGAGDEFVDALLDGVRTRRQVIARQP